MKGITLASYRQYRPGATKAQLRAISDAEVRAIYRQGYWDAVRGDDLPAGLDLVAFDAAVNSGPSRGARWLQGAVGAAQDGVIGPKTIEAAARVNPVAAVHAACDARMQFLRSLSTWPTFGKGWQRRVDDIRAQAAAMVSTPPSPSRPTTNPLATLWAWLRNLWRQL